MNISKKARAGIVAGAAIAAVSLTGIGAVAANAADSTTSSSSTTQARTAHAQEAALTGATADSVKAAVLAKYPGATVLKMEADTDEGVAYEAHITKADGTHAKVLLDSSFTVTGEAAGKGPHAGKGPKGDKGTQGATGTRVQETALTGATADSVKAAVLAKYPGATVTKMETDSDDGATYEAYITKADGTKAKVLLDSSFAVTGEKAWSQGKGPDGKGAPGQKHRGMHHGQNGTQPSAGATASSTN